MSQQHAKIFVQHAKFYATCSNFVQHAQIFVQYAKIFVEHPRKHTTILLSAMKKTSSSNNFHDFYPWITTHLWSNVQNIRLI